MGGVEADEAVGKVTVELGRVRVLKGVVRSKLKFYWVENCVEVSCLRNSRRIFR